MNIADLLRRPANAPAPPPPGAPAGAAAAALPRDDVSHTLRRLDGIRQLAGDAQ